jgi:hypothetical protein
MESEIVIIAIRVIKRLSWVCLAYASASLIRILFYFDQYKDTLLVNICGLIASILVLLMLYSGYETNND